MTPHAPVHYSKFFCLLLSLVLIGGVGCSRTTLSPEELEAASQETVVWLQQKYGFIQLKGAAKMFRRISTRLSDSLKSLEMADELQIADRYTILVLNHNEPNAFSLGAGKIVVTRGLFAALTTEAEFAAVVAHEMAHDALTHHQRALTDLVERPENQTPQFSFFLEEEKQADLLGLGIMRQAHYDLRYALSAFTLVYRPENQTVALTEESWWEKRAATLKRLIQDGEHFLPATENTREFTRLRARFIGQSAEMMSWLK